MKRLIIYGISPAIITIAVMIGLLWLTRDVACEAIGGHYACFIGRSS
jgi:hypothetical protein